MFTSLRGSRDCMIVGFTYAISVFHHYSCESESRSWWGVLDTTFCKTVCQWLVTGRWFSLGTPVSSTNNIDRHDIIEILLKVTLNTITLLTKLTHQWCDMRNTHIINYNTQQESFNFNSFRLTVASAEVLTFHFCNNSCHFVFIKGGPSWSWSYGSWIYNYLCCAISAYHH